MQHRRMVAAIGLALALSTGSLMACGAEGGGAAESAPATTADPSSSTTTDEFEIDGGFGAFDDDDCFIDEDGHGPDCDPVEGSSGGGVDDCFIDEDGHGPDCDPVEGSSGGGVDDCFIDEDGHGPDCEMGLGGPDDLRFLTGWDATGEDLDIGTMFTLTCEPGGTPGPVWGTGPYADDSSLCTAAVHAGKITVAEGGTVGGERTGSRRTLPGGLANGIDARPIDHWRGAIEFL